MSPRLSPVACTLLAALAGAAGAASASGQTVTLHRAGEDVRITVGDVAALPADFPADVALPTTHTVVRVDHSRGSTTIVVATPGTVEDVAGRFREGMIAAGWKAAAVAPPPVGIGQAWTKRPRAVIAWIKPGDSGGVELQLQLLAPAKP
jgi:hypothetical protein